MVQFKRAAPGSIVNLRKWAPGRVAQLKLMLAHLEQGANSSLASQVLQSPRRTFSTFVPVIPIQNIETEVAFREVRVKFTPPRGLRRLLFYEFDLSETENFAQFDRFFSPDPYFVFSDLLDDVTFYIRIRVVTGRGRVGPFSDPVAVSTPRARSQVFIEDSELELTVRLNSQLQILENVSETTTYILADPPSGNGNASPVSTIELFRFDFESLGSSVVYYSIDYEISLVLGSNVASPIHWQDVIFRWFEDDNENASSPENSRNRFKQAGQDMRLTLYGMKTNADFVATGDTGSITIPGPFSAKRMGTLIQKPRTFTAGEHSITLGVIAGAGGDYPTPNDWSLGSGRIFGDINTSDGPQVQVKLKNFNLFEAITAAVA